MGGIEEVADQFLGNYKMRDRFKYFNNKYLRPFLIKKSAVNEPKIIETHSRLNLIDAVKKLNDQTKVTIEPGQSFSTLVKNYTEVNLRQEIGSCVGRNQTTVMRICDRWMQEGTTDRRGRSHPPHCTTSCEDRQILLMAVTDCSVTSRIVAQHIESVTHHSVSPHYYSTPFTAEWSVRKTSIAWSTLDAGPQTSPTPMER
ncbi:hypothetical protein TNCV_258251 [Trichonephila clavipes]|uniref:Transposase n=1 Tax=Trichonephila clavipes TaxID=2585209 RepID=A0A8X6RYM0_TRICX|nr:hypothetical protein TNCV_258251 [Trichonephila clavipes]